MDQKQRKRTTLGPIEESVLEHLSAGDILMSFLLSGRSTHAFYKEAYKRAHARYKYKRSIQGLQKRGLVKLRGDTLFLTIKGKELIEVLASRTAKSSNVWTGHWWIVMYDIPISMNPYRFELRRILIRSGFKKLQHSVWVHFQPCKEIEVFLRHNPVMNKFVRYIETIPFPYMERIEDWKKLSST